ncbi:hypothetical protein KC19_VG297400 [Ceratodon purpureus]|uniref:Uncharacterized protein n=1 Tax=Ceratodon purpureus TaxID=3225 RepID=A0A8T0HVJ6_CERPU|nr:hypothetical protein KC19_VG297400 [Ceratodon purpureus]
MEINTNREYEDSSLRRSLFDRNVYSTVDQDRRHYTRKNDSVLSMQGNLLDSSKGITSNYQDDGAAVLPSGRSHYANIEHMMEPDVEVVDDDLGNMSTFRGRRTTLSNDERNPKRVTVSWNPDVLEIRNTTTGDSLPEVEDSDALETDVVLQAGTVTSFSTEGVVLVPEGSKMKTVASAMAECSSKKSTSMFLDGNHRPIYRPWVIRYSIGGDHKSVSNGGESDASSEAAK